MTIASLAFLGFALVVAILFNLTRVAWWRDGVFLIGNVCFLYSFSSDPRTWIPMVCFLAGGYAGLRILQWRPEKPIFLVLLFATLVGFFWLKRYSFLPAASFITVPYATIGLSYMFFRLMHLLIDAYGKDLPGIVGPVSYLNYMINFTTLVSGPIQRYQDFSIGVESPRRDALRLTVIGEVVERVVIGFFKVTIVSVLFLTVHQRALAAFADAGSLVAKVLFVCVFGAGYTFYLYYNFAGYCDIVIGIARLFGLTLPENFNHPFAANNFLDFWGRWHMTLSNWLRVYVYNPLLKAMMMRVTASAFEPFLGVIAFFVTFFLIGLWHGQTAVFALYGLLLGLGVSGNKLYQVAMAKALGRRPYRELAARFWYQMAARGLTFTWFTLSLFCFWAGWDQISAICTSLDALGMVLVFVIMMAGSGLAFAILEAPRRAAINLLALSRPVLLSRYARTVYATTLASVVLGTILLLTRSAPNIVYEKF